MLKSIRDLASNFGLSDADEHVDENGKDKRYNTRFPFGGIPFVARIDKIYTTLRMKDLSSGGAAGLLDEPVSVGDILYVEFDDKHHIEAEVRWVRRIMVGLKFTRPLEPVYVQSVYANFLRKPEQDEG